MRYLLVFLLSIFISNYTFSQGCCSGGSGSPIAGGVSAGVLQEGQMELGLNYQNSFSNQLYSGSKLDTLSSNKIDNLSSNYLYAKMAYGITKKLTLSVETGYYLDRTLVKLHPENIDNTQKSSGNGDLIIFPRYDIYDRTSERYHTEITLGLGIKIPLGKANDSTMVYEDPSTGQKTFTTSAPTVQTTTGSHDIIFYGFVLHEFKKAKFRVFANALYVRKGWNPLGEKFGDYIGAGLFTSKTFFKKLGVTLQVKGEWIGPMEGVAGVGLSPADNLMALYNVDLNSTGSKKFSFVPQISYSYKSFTFFALSDMPFYQFMNGTQIGSQYLFTAGMSYRFMPGKFLWKKVE